jgi:hypothetical protein
MAYIWNNEPLGGRLPPSYFQHVHSPPQPTHPLLCRHHFQPAEKHFATGSKAVKKTAPIWLFNLCQILDIHSRNSKDLHKANSVSQKAASFTLADTVNYQPNSPIESQKEVAVAFFSTAMEFM